MAENTQIKKIKINPIEMYQGAMGGWNEYKKGDTRHQSTHKLLSNEEFDEMKNRVNRARKHAEEIEQDKNHEIDELKARHHGELQDLKAKANAAIDKAKSSEAYWKAEAEKQADLNANLLRISKERANAQRGIQPKKQRTGYRFSGKISQVNIPSGYTKKNEPKQVQVWTTTLQTPYDGTIPLAQIKDHITNDLKTKILGLLNLRYFVSENTENLWKGYYAQLEDFSIDSNANYLLDYKFLINPKDKLWEVRIYTTREIPLVEI